ncbi:MAG: DUF898 family protein [Sphingomonadaceae bacterium]|nr:DUF898 family protein [Sphingomonadaceae bacterium]
MIDDDTGQRLAFTGRWPAFLGMVVVNVLLTVVTLGIYRFWAKTRVRRYLWENTLVGGEPLEYFGRGIEKLKGAFLVFLMLVLPLIVVTGVAAWLKTQGMIAAALLVYVGLYVLLLYLFGVGSYRSQRYMLSRTAWRGIRAGMTTGGWGYGVRFLKLALFHFITFGFGAPFVATKLWNARMNDAVFGTAAVTADANWRAVYGRFLFAWFGAIVVYIVAIGAVFASFGSQLAAFAPGAPPPADPRAMIGIVLRLYLVFFVAGLAIAVLMLRYYAALIAELFGATRVGGLGFIFTARAGQFLAFMLGNLAIIAFTLGLGVLMMPYRVWSFYLRHLQTTGSLDTAALGQTRLRGPSQGDGLVDAFDAAAF